MKTMDAHTVTQVIQSCQNRADMYRLFASLVDKEVSEQTAGALCKLKDIPLDPKSSSAERECARGLRTMAKYVSHFSPTISDDLACEFATIFLAAGTYTGTAAVPYESIYTSEEHILMQDARDQVRAIYRKARVMPATKESIPEDYLPFEFEFMAHISDEIVKAMRTSDVKRAQDLVAQQNDFLHTHLENWVGDWIKDVNRMAKSEFYHSLAEAIQGFLACDHDDLHELSSVVVFDAA